MNFSFLSRSWHNIRSKRKTLLAKHGKRAFWIWITYQAIKGTLTTSLIWVPLILATCHFTK
ncbi:MAG: hypothetical protein COY40_04655 [Alphaproteobacteria bacterium CG_4_10_14_0_8_um_filter_53_9]|nr:MAG: hypothetical protein COY40_04655 [Alphaproteobacteria bacterium CG_4_10_14_0_8_um_filter_53_9]